MRKDMHKVLVERPRYKPYNADRKNVANRTEDLPNHESMKGRHSGRKQLNENLAPLWRFLDKRVGMSWDSVYAEIREIMDVRSATQLHIFQHIRDAVVADTHSRLVWPRYVIDSDGVLRKNEQRPRFPKKKRKKLDPNRVLLRRDGTWYLCRLKALSDALIVEERLRYLDPMVEKDCALYRAHKMVYGVEIRRYYPSSYDAWLSGYVALQVRGYPSRSLKPMPCVSTKHEYGDGFKYCVSYRVATTQEIERAR